MAWRSELRLSADHSAAAVARDFAAALLGEHHLTSDGHGTSNCLLIVSELVTNAVRAGSSIIDLRIAHRSGGVRVEVADDADGWPQQRRADSTAVNGRGLMLIDALASAWGVNALAFGKLVWAQVDL